MLQNGLGEEIQALLQRGISAKCTAMQAIGYKEVVDALEGRGTIAEAAAQVQQSSRRYAKRQLTWFRRNPDMNWIIRQPGDNFDKILQEARHIAAQSDK
jgi:tRNA dimethylallyltransferase